MCELFGLSSSATTSIEDGLMRFRARGGADADNPDGWGLAYRENGRWQLHKAAEAAANSEHYLRLTQGIHSGLLIAHVRKANPPSAHTPLNTHPFVRDCCGRSWIFAHNGKVPEVTQPQGCCHPHQSQPQGETDSEHAFCFLLEEIATVFTQAAADNSTPWLQKLASLSGDIAAYGQFNFLMSDGMYLIAYGHDRLHYLEKQQAGLQLTQLATEPLSQEAWQPFAAGELRVYHSGQLSARLLTRATAATLSHTFTGVEHAVS
jgi:predicted glutamine amidotransferase